jgi:hypothetical protein
LRKAPSTPLRVSIPEFPAFFLLMHLPVETLPCAVGRLSPAGPDAYSRPV